MSPSLVTLLMVVGPLPFLSTETTANEGCERKIDRVCGSDGVTYNNECLLKRKSAALMKDAPAGTTTNQLVVAYEGPCWDEDANSESCDEPCTSLYQPVCGSDGRTYSNYCMLKVANCERKSELVVVIKYVGECQDDDRAI